MINYGVRELLPVYAALMDCTKGNGLSNPYELELGDYGSTSVRITPRMVIAEVNNGHVVLTVASDKESYVVRPNAITDEGEYTLDKQLESHLKSPEIPVTRVNGVGQNLKAGKIEGKTMVQVSGGIDQPSWDVESDCTVHLKDGCIFVWIENGKVTQYRWYEWKKY